MLTKVAIDLQLPAVLYQSEQKGFCPGHLGTSKVLSERINCGDSRSGRH